jgi:hypothetical protein
MTWKKNCCEEYVIDDLDSEASRKGWLEPGKDYRIVAKPSELFSTKAKWCYTGIK